MGKKYPIKTGVLAWVMAAFLVLSIVGVFAQQNGAGQYQSTGLNVSGSAGNGSSEVVMQSAGETNTSPAGGIASENATAPFVVSVTPTDTGNMMITVTFSEEMDQTTINSGTFTVFEVTDAGSLENESLNQAGTQAGTLPVMGIVIYEDRVATFIPTGESSDEQSLFIATISSGAADLEGNTLEEDYSWNFTSTRDELLAAAGISEKENSGQDKTNETAVAGVFNVDAIGQSLWPFILGGLTLLLALLVLYLFLRRQREAQEEHAALMEAGHRANPFGNVHQVEDVEGISPMHARRLNEIGIVDTQQLWEADPEHVASHLDVSQEGVQKWQHLAELMAIKGIDPKNAELLELAGIETIAQLKRFHPRNLLNRIRSAADGLMDYQGNLPGEATVSNWIHEARRHRAT